MNKKTLLVCSLIVITGLIIGFTYAYFEWYSGRDDQTFIYARNSDGSIDYTKLVSYGGQT